MATSVDIESGLDGSSGAAHQTVLLNEAVTELVTDKSGLYIDGTFGRGGHSRKILEELTAEGRLLGVDKDPEAILSANELKSEDPRFSIYHGSFKELGVAATAQGWNGVAGILLDLGVSSPQIDDASRGFSFLNDGPLDMRMNQEQELTAKQVVNYYEEDKLEFIFKSYADIRNARLVARKIVEAREVKEFETTTQLIDVVKLLTSFKKENQFLAQIFQAIRIEVNQELEVLKEFLKKRRVFYPKYPE